MQCCYRCLLYVSSVEFSDKPFRSHSTVRLSFLKNSYGGQLHARYATLMDWNEVAPEVTP